MAKIEYKTVAVKGPFMFKPEDLAEAVTQELNRRAEEGWFFLDLQITIPFAYITFERTLTELNRDE